MRPASWKPVLRRHLFIFSRFRICQQTRTKTTMSRAIGVLLVLLGAALAQQCPPHCFAGYCDKSGQCGSCSGNWWGPTCSNACPAHCWTGQCGFKTGTCGSCSGKWWGPTCDNACPTHCWTGQCDFETGRCGSCSGNWWGPTCANPCPPHCWTGQCDFETGYCGSCSGPWAGPRCTVPANVQGDCEHALNSLINELTIGKGCEKLTETYFERCTEEVALELLKNPFKFVFRIGEFSLGCLLGSFGIYASCELAGEKAFEAAFGRLENYLCELLVNALSYVSGLGARGQSQLTLDDVLRALLSPNATLPPSRQAIPAISPEAVVSGPPAWPSELAMTYAIDYPFNASLPGLSGSIVYSQTKQLFVQTINMTLPSGNTNVTASVTDYRSCNSSRPSYTWNSTTCAAIPTMFCTVPADPFSSIIQGLYLNVSAFQQVAPDTYVGPAGSGNFTAEYITTHDGLPQLLSVASTETGSKWLVVRFTSVGPTGPESFNISPKCKQRL
eukprot:m.229785 g.229785  ORF g.229785 m.229785 type:complete len:500 (-) comp17829_c0_seq1:24-1523(-)